MARSISHEYVGKWPHVPDYSHEMWGNYTWNEGITRIAVKKKSEKDRYFRLPYEFQLMFCTERRKYLIIKPFIGSILGEGNTPEEALKNMHIRQRVKGEV